MGSYKSIIKRIIDIIELSNDAKKGLSPEAFEINYNKYFAKILWNDISVEYADEFQSLLDLERTIHVFNNTVNPTLKNISLIQLCESKITSEANADKYVELLELLKKTNGKTLFELIEYQGYYVVKDDLGVFINLCRQLQVGCGEIAHQNSDKLQALLDENKKQKHDQFQRISFYSQTNLQNEHDNNQIELYNRGSEEAGKVIEKSENGIIRCNFGKIICLAIMGKLNIDMIIELKKLLSPQDFNELVEKLSLWQVFSEEELNRIVNSKLDEAMITSVDELIEYFAKKDYILVKNLQEMIPSIGKHNYRSLIDGLYKLGSIGFDDYIEAMSVAYKKM